MTDPAARWRDALGAAAIAAGGAAGLVVRAREGPVRAALLDELARLSPAGTVRITAESDPEMLAEGPDVLASVAAGRTVARASLAARVGDRMLLVAGAERLPAATAGLIARAIDAGALPRLVLLDEGIDDERVAALLDDRVAMRVDLDALSMRDAGDALELRTNPNVPVHVEPFGRLRMNCRPSDASRDTLPPAGQVSRLRSTRTVGGEEREQDGGSPVDPDAALTALCEAAAMFGIGSVRVPLNALAVARAAVAIDGRDGLTDDDVAFAARLVLAPRALTLPPAKDDDEHDEADGAEAAPAELGQYRDRVIDAVRSVLPPDLLETFSASRARGAGGSAEAMRGSGSRGRPGRVRRGLPARGARLDLVATLVAAAPFQRLRDRPAGAAVAIRRDDVRIRRPRPVQRALTIFAVDASGSSAVARLAEVKGAVEQLLAESYVRRDEVALIAFRGDGAETLLPPTRSLARAKRELAALPGGGTTPLAAGIVAALEQALRSRAAGRAPLILLLTDGGANVARDGNRGRAAAQADAEAAARLVATAGIAAAIVDSAPRGDAQVRALAAAMGARYVRLPGLDAARLGAVARAA